MSLSPNPLLNVFCPHRDKLWESVGSASHLELTPNPPRFLLGFSSEPVKSRTPSHYPPLITLALRTLLEAVLAFLVPSPLLLWPPDNQKTQNPEKVYRNFSQAPPCFQTESPRFNREAHNLPVSPTPPISHRSTLRLSPPAPAAHLCAPDIFSFPFTLSRTCFPGSHVAFPKWHLPLLPFPDHAN